MHLCSLVTAGSDPVEMKIRWQMSRELRISITLDLSTFRASNQGVCCLELQGKDADALASESSPQEQKLWWLKVSRKLEVWLHVNISITFDLSTFRASNQGVCCLELQGKDDDALSSESSQQEQKLWWLKVSRKLEVWLHVNISITFDLSTFRASNQSVCCLELQGKDADALSSESSQQEQKLWWLKVCRTLCTLVR